MNQDTSNIDTATPPPEERRRLLHERVRIPMDRLAALCERYGVRRLAFFGSVLRHDFRPDSDLDVLVEYRPGTRTGFRFFELEEELTALFGRKVDLNTIGSLHPRFRDEVLAEAEQVYDAA
jgi:predicted nucleotidyltransferase